MEFLEEIDKQVAVQVAHSIMRNGWVGPPIVVDGDFVINGHHRYYAVTRYLGWSEDRVPKIDIRDIFKRAGMDWDTTLQEVDGDFVRAWSRLPAPLLEKFNF